MSPPQRRLSAIVSIDAAGYGRLVGRDEARTLRALAAIYVKRLEPAVQHHNGRVVRTTSDGALLEFDDVVDAVRAAVELQEGVARSVADVPPERRLELRVGVNVGDVVALAGGEIFGDAVNVATQLQALAEPGAICVADRVYEQLAGKIDLPFRDLGERRLETTDRSFRAWQWSPGGTGGIAAPALPDKPSIVVLPFDSMGDDGGQQAFADGITEDITTELARFRSLFVIARNSAFTYKGRSVDVRQVARELGVRYVLEGSMRRSGSRVRVTAQLIEAASGTHLWAERYDRVVEDIFDVQDAITRSIVAAVAPEVEGAELKLTRRGRPADLKAHEIALQAWNDAWHSYTRPDRVRRDRAIARAEEALRIDPTCVRALITLALAHWQHANFRTAPLQDSVRRAVEAATRAQELDRMNHQAFIFRGLALMIGQRFAEAMADIRHAYDLNPSDPSSLIARGWCEVASGNTAIGVPMLLDALRISPRDPQQYNAYTSLCAAGFVDGDYARGVEWGETGKRQHPDYPPIHHYLALNYVGLGQLERAAAEIETLRRVAPEWLAERLAGFSGMVRPADRERSRDFLRIAAGETT
ncbi:MAG TPA: adenylate/guanylate cyclase domain-containing protein [Vineibacter sp.]|nr:adenylate/guanylate cyclase domain-containing protein [Vineibacter sp.]